MTRINLDVFAPPTEERLIAREAAIGTRTEAEIAYDERVGKYPANALKPSDDAKYLVKHLWMIFIAVPLAMSVVFGVIIANALSH